MSGANNKVLPRSGRFLPIARFYYTAQTYGDAARTARNFGAGQSLRSFAVWRWAMTSPA